jgi:hypothetical protein
MVGIGKFALYMVFLGFIAMHCMARSINADDEDSSLMADDQQTLRELIDDLAEKRNFNDGDSESNEDMNSNLSFDSRGNAASSFRHGDIPIGISQHDIVHNAAHLAAMRGKAKNDNPVASGRRRARLNLVDHDRDTAARAKGHIGRVRH